MNLIGDFGLLFRQTHDTKGISANGRKGVRKVDIMKKITIILLGVLCAASLSPAAGKITFGVKAGMISSNMATADTEVEWSSKWGITGGVFACFALSDMFAVQPEILYSPMGAQYALSDGTTTLSLTATAPYVTVPLLLKFYLPTGASGGVKPAVFAGPYLGFKAGKGKIVYDEVYSGQHHITEDSWTVVNSSDFGFVLGAGLEFPLETAKITLDARWGTSLSTISKTEDTKYKFWTFLLGYSFN